MYVITYMGRPAFVLDRRIHGWGKKCFNEQSACIVLLDNV